MKKAKRYAKDFDAHPTVDNLWVICQAFFAEIAELSKQRGTSSSAIMGILDEQDRKWKAFARRTENETVRGNGFEYLFKRVRPDGWVLWRGSDVEKQKLFEKMQQKEVLLRLVEKIVG